MIKRLLILVLLLLSASTVRANTVFITQSGGGAGTSCASPQSFAYFNNAANWTAGTPTGIQIGPGTVVHICPGTFTFSTGTNNVLVFQGDGGAGNPVSLVAADGAVVITAPAWGTGSAGQAVVTTNGHSNVCIDGMSNLTIQTTANGTNFANHIN